MSAKKPPEDPPSELPEGFKQLRQLDPNDPLDNAIRLVSGVWRVIFNFFIDRDLIVDDRRSRRTGRRP